MKKASSAKCENCKAVRSSKEMAIQTDNLLDEKAAIRSPPPLRVVRMDSGVMFKIDQNRGDMDDLDEGESIEYSEEFSESFEELQNLENSSKNETVKCSPSTSAKQDLTESTKFQGFIHNWIRASPELRGSFCEVEGRVSRTPGLSKACNDSMWETVEHDLDRSQCIGKEIKKRFERLVMIEKMSMQERFGKKMGFRKF
jgi:hypothetical protein